MPSERKFFRTTFKVVVLSEDTSVENIEDLAEIATIIDTGDCVGDVSVDTVEQITGPQAATALYALRSEPGFFMLDDDGNDTED